VGRSAYLDRRGRPARPSDLATHDRFAYADLRTRDAWHFANTTGEDLTVRPPGGWVSTTERRCYPPPSPASASRPCQTSSLGTPWRTTR